MMRIPQRLLFMPVVALCGLLPALLSASADWPQDHSDLQPDPAATFGVLDNGLRYIILPHDEPPERISLRLFVDAGSLMETESQRGLAHFLEHMAFNGTRNFEAGEMVEYFQRLGMAFGPDTNAHTWWKETVYKLELPNSEPAIVDDGMLLLRDYADGMLLLEEEIEQERGIILAEKRSRDTVEYRSFLNEIEFILPHSLIPDRVTIGIDEVIANAPREEFVDYYNKWYTTDRMVLIAVGAVEPDAFAKVIEEHFGSMPANPNPLPDPPLGYIQPSGLKAQTYRDLEAKNVSVAIQHVQPFPQTPDTLDYRQQAMLRSLATGMISRRLEIRSRDIDAPFIRGVAYGYDWLNFLTNAGIEMDCQPENWEVSLMIAEQELRRALQYGFTQAELDEARAKALNGLEMAAKQASTRPSRELSSSIVRAVSSERVFTAPAYDLEVMSAFLATVTTEECHQALKALWPSEDRLIYISGNLAPEQARESIVLQAYARSATVAVNPPEESERVEFAYTSFGKAGQFVEESHDKELDITQLRLSNNVYVNYKPTEFEANTIRVGLRFGAGKLESNPAKPGLSMLADAAFIEGGLGKHSSDELQSILAGKSVSVDFSVDHDSFFLQGVTTPEDLELQLQLLCAYLTDPGFRPESLRLAHERMKEAYTQWRHTPSGVWQDDVINFLGGGDYRFGYPPEEVFQARTLEELSAWLKEPLQSSRLELSIVGDFDEANLRDLVQSTFGALPQRSKDKPAYDERRTVQYPTAVDYKRFDFTSQIPKAMACVFWPTDDLWDISQTRRLSVLSEALSDRMRIKIREEIGEAYSPYAFNRSSETYQDYGVMTALVILDPEQAQSISALLQEIGHNLYRNGISQDELERALQPTINRIELTRRDNVYWLRNVLLSSQEYPQRLEWAKTIEDDIAAITRADINALAKKFLHPDRSMQVHIMPHSTGGAN